MVDYINVKNDPASFFKRPSDILIDTSLSHHEKIDLLRRWAYDEREMSVAEEENMTSANADDRHVLDEILKALLVLGVDEGKQSPTKQG